MKNVKNFLWHAIQVFAILGTFAAFTGCTPKLANLSKPTPIQPAYNPFYDSGTSLRLDEPTVAIVAGPGVAFQDSTAPNGNRFIIVKIAGEIKIDLGTAPQPPKDTTPTTPPIITQNDGIGANTFPWVPLEKLDFFSTLRCYIASGWIFRPGGLFVQPMYQAETAEMHGLDDFFTAAKNRGIDILPCINQTPEWFRNTGNGTGSNDFPFIKPGLSRTDVKSWEPYAEYWFQFVCRYGATVHPLTDLRVDTTARWPGDIKNVPRSGLGLIRAVEINNEVDRWWDKGTEKYVTGAEHATMLAAVIKAIRRADPGMKIVMAGLTGFDLPYLREMDAAFKKLGIAWPDIVNVHHYSHEGNQAGVWPPTWWNDGATYPENDKDFSTIGAIVEFGKSIGRPVWVTEFGADTRAPSWMHVQGSKFGVTDEQAQATLIEKTFRAYRQAGVQRAYVFMAADEGGQGLWQSCGLLSSQATGYKPKPSYYTIKQLVEEIRKPVNRN